MFPQKISDGNRFFDAPEAFRALSGTEWHGRVWLKWVSRLIPDMLEINTS